MSATNGYNGWRNRETWNVALWLGNDEGLYRLVREAMINDITGLVRPQRGAWVRWVRPVLLEIGFEKTPDGVSLFDSKLSIGELNDLVFELAGGEL